MKVSFHGQSCVKIETVNHTLLIDPFITGNSTSDLQADQQNPDVILLTHGHNDHVGDTVSIAKRTGCLVVAPNELAVYLESRGLKTHPMHIGGAHTFDFGKVKLTPAFHGSLFVDEDGTHVYGGMPAGLLIYAEDKTIYHAGDTGLFSDLKLIGDRNEIDLAFLPIGDNFTMGPEDALLAADWIQAKQVVPMHYNTFPLIEQDGAAFSQQVKTGKGVHLQPGESIEL
ncbi:metal-dependent hydrolase [Gracilibacillus alcaliphilus]|uniref:metal-dependent hydrolase n=1 Tax=Gracilibacillus alcaliphilus TaxID=1401441 RepID=UPI0019570B34|nr:L-ascorbate metabolism protein UlaG (beta-lactamase superfamily) [Gracilibacillus alcaliphilus]